MGREASAEGTGRRARIVGEVGLPTRDTTVRDGKITKRERDGEGTGIMREALIDVTITVTTTGVLLLKTIVIDELH